MGDMIFIHADETRNELRAVDGILNADMEINIAPAAEIIDNTWSMTVPEKVWEQAPVLEGHWIYWPWTEWGGEVSLVKHSTADRSVTMEGPTFRGILYQKRLIPPTDADYLVIDDQDANEVIREAVGGRYGSLVHVSDETYGKDLSVSWRYQALATGIQNALRDAQLRLNVIYDNVRGSIVLSAAKVTDLTLSGSWLRRARSTPGDRCISNRYKILLEPPG